MSGWVWARGPVEPDRAHVREVRDGLPVVNLVEGHLVGFALCGAWLVADVLPEDGHRFLDCSRCVDIVAGIERGDTPEPRWSADE